MPPTRTGERTRPARYTRPVPGEPALPQSNDFSLSLLTSACAGGEPPEVFGIPLAELASATSFPEVAYLWLWGELPDEEHLADFRTLLVEAAELPPAVAALRDEWPLHTAPVEAVRAAVTALGLFDPLAGQTGKAAVRSQAITLLARLPLAFTADGLKPEPDDGLGYAADVCRLLTGSVPRQAEEAAFEADLILAAPATGPHAVAARLAASRGSDLTGVVAAALCGWEVAHTDPSAAVARCLAAVPVWAALAIEAADSPPARLSVKRRALKPRLLVPLEER